MRRSLLGMTAVGMAALAATAALGSPDTMEFTPTQKRHWGWKKPSRPPVPRVKYSAWVRNPVDAFVLAKLEAAGLKPAPTASREQLIRRLSFDLTGLPPTPEEVDRFLADRSPGAWERLVDRYLASPQYGERWARHWLDLARYADSNGYEFDEARPDAWRYRDYVVRSLNQDKPYDRFVMEQLAGDEIAPQDPDALIATGFNLLGPDMTDAADQVARRQNTLNDMTDTAGLVFLGLTVGCARCHDHKYEPISIKDYYKLQAFFTPAKFRKDLPAATPEEQARFEKLRMEHERKVAAAREELDRLAGDVRRTLREQRLATLREDLRTAFTTPEKDRTTEQQILVERNAASLEPAPKDVLPKLPEADRPRYQAAADTVARLEKARPQPPSAIGLSEDGSEAPKTFVLERGELSNRGAAVEPGFPIIMAGIPAPAPAPTPVGKGSGRRTVLAKWIASKENPLTARVMVNRVWQYHFGRGIVPTPSDFGVRGESPTHPELLDWLAVWFASPAAGSGEYGGVGVWGYGSRNLPKAQSSTPTALPHTPTRPHPHTGSPNAQRRTPNANTALPGASWSLKQLHRLILTSNAYKQSSMPSAAALAKDPDNLLFSRQNRQRLQAEAVRDSLLAVSGRLNLKMGGPGVFPPMPEGALPKAAVWPVSARREDHVRRSLYVFIRRNLQFPAFEAFDAPDTNQSCPRRESSTTAPQALALLNTPEVMDAARSLADRLAREAETEEGRVELAYRVVLARRPTAAELRLGTGFLKESPLTEFCRALLNVNEFVYID